MDLNRVKLLVEDFQSKLDDEEKAEVLEKAEGIRGYMGVKLAALTETDRAAVAWYCMELLAHIYHSPVSEVSETLESSTVTYAVTAAQLLGWM